jgi:hypothetical protein
MTSEGRTKVVALVAIVALGALGWFVLSPSEPKRRAVAPTELHQPDNQVVESPRARGAPPSIISAEPFQPLAETRRDRELRERAKDQILKSLSSAKRGPGYTGSSGGPEPVGELDKDYVQKRIREDFLPMAKECYDAALERDGGLSGRMVFQFVIVGDESVGGVVESAELDPSSTLDEGELVTCMRESLLSVTFPPPKRGGRVTVTFPFTLSPVGDGG